MTWEVNLHMNGNRALLFNALVKDDNMDAKETCTAENCKLSPVHSRNSSNASNTSSALISPVSSRNLTRWPSANSSLVISADSTADAVKPALQDLVEEPAEKDEHMYGDPKDSLNEPCIWDDLFCEHQCPRPPRSAEVVPSSATSGTSDPSTSDDDLSTKISTERRTSDGSSEGTISTRKSRSWRSVSKCLQDRRPRTSASRLSTRSAPSSRSSSTRNFSIRKDSALHHGATASIPTFAPPAQRSEGNVCNPSTSSWSFSITSTAFESTQDLAQDPIERQEHSATPLLPPMMADLHSQAEDGLRSPLQSPSTATQRVADSTFSSPLTSPTTHNVRSPSLSAKPSLTSIGMDLSKYARHVYPDVPPLSMSKEIDEWAIKLGHANFHIVPEPYVPSTCDFQSCNRFLEDWKAAQVEYVRQAARISEHHGPTSRTYELACQKWEHIEAEWRLHFLHAQQQAEVNGETVDLKPLQGVRSFSIPDKFPDIDDADIVGPMVQYTKMEQTPPKKKMLLLLFTDPASILRRL